MLNDIKNKFKDFKPYINGYEKMRRASVLVPIVKIDGIYNILFEVRSKNLRTQPSEISFPGGKIELDESPYEAAVRETCEELGTNSSNIEVFSQLDLLVTPMNMIIHPYLGYIEDAESLNINKDEVDHIFFVPISYLLENSPANYDNSVHIVPNKDFPYDKIPNKEQYNFEKGNYPVLFYEYNDYIIWGITAKILDNFLSLITN